MNRYGTMSKSRGWLFWGVMGLAVLGARVDPALAEERAQPFGVIGNEQVVWVFQGMTHAESGRTGLFFTYRLQGGDKKTEFALRPVGPIGGEIAAMAVCGRRLHIVYSDGTHQSLNPPSGPLSLFTGCKRVRERNLPGAAVPLMLAGDDVDEMLYALVTARQARELLPDQKPSVSEEAGRVADGVVAEPEQELGGEAWLRSELAIARFGNGRWILDRDAPADCSLSGRPLAMWVDGARIHLIYETKATSQSVVYQVSASASEPWSTAAPWPQVFEGTLASGSIVDGKPTLLTGSGAERDGILGYWQLGEGGWRMVPPLAQGLAGVPLTGGCFAAYLSTSHIGLVRREDDETLWFSRWGVGDGAAVERQSLIRALVPPEPPLVSPAAKHVLEYSVLALSLAAVFFWRRSDIVRHPSLPPNQVLARISRRMLAFMIDMVILAPALVAIFYRLLLLDDGGTLTWDESGLPGDVPGRYWSRAWVGVCVAIYGAVFEAAMGATPGKRALKLQVVRSHGQRISIGAAIVRNLVRVVEFHFVPLLLLVAVTFGKQRLGDLIARSYVVESDGTERPSADDDGYDDTDFG